MKSNQINLRKDLINEELKYDIKRGFEFHYKKLSNKFLNWLFRHYYIQEFCENYYNSEPDYDNEEFNMYMDYCYNVIPMKSDLTNTALFNIILNPDAKQYSKEPHSIEELKQAYEKIIKMRKDYESRRIEFCNWQEVNFKGNWGMTQNTVDENAKRTLRYIKKCFPTSIKERLYYAQKDDLILIYFYGRDLWDIDYWFIFKKKKNKNPRRVKRRTK